MCQQCKDTGMRYVSTGHRKMLYPFSEGHVAEPCSCKAGDAIKQQNNRTMFPDSVLLEVAERNKAEKMTDEGRVQCRDHWCTSWVDENGIGLCEYCERERRYE